MTIQGNGQKINLTPLAKGEIKPTGDVKKPDTAELKEAEGPVKELDGLAIGATIDREAADKVIRCFPGMLEKPSIPAWMNALEDMDKDGDRAISEQEFIADWMQDHPPGPLAHGCGTAHYAQQVAIAKMMFNGIDRDDNGKITYFESEGLPKQPDTDFDFRAPGMLRGRVNFEDADKDRDGQLTREEFGQAIGLNGMLPIAMYLDEEGKPVTPITRAFEQIDRDNDGKISVDEAKQFETEVITIFEGIYKKYDGAKQAE